MLDPEEQLRLAQFSLDCGVDRFTLEPALEQAEKLLEEFSLGMIRLPDHTHPRSFMKKQHAWRTTSESLAALNVLLIRLETPFLGMAFYRNEASISIIRHEGAGFFLWEEQREHLFRLGFDFSVIESDGSYRPFSADELSERKRPSSLPRQTLEEVLNNKYGIESRRPSVGIKAIDKDVLKNPNFYAWWNADHDNVLRAQISRDGLAWWPSIPGLLRVADSAAVGQWKRSDPACLKTTWRDLIVAFARARADLLGLEEIADLHDAQQCTSCTSLFQLSDVEARGRKQSPYFKRVPGFNSICAKCISNAYNAAGETRSRSEMLAFASSLCQCLGRIPTLAFGRSTADYETVAEARLPLLIEVLGQRPATHLVEKTFGSWLQLLIESGVLAGEVRKTARGTQCVANDGHVCLSLGEKVIDDLLHQLGIPHSKEIKYPGTNLRCDFFVHGTYIEYFGLTGSPQYDQKTLKKRLLCEASGWQLLSIFPKDLLRLDQLQASLRSLQERYDISTRSKSYLES